MKKTATLTMTALAIGVFCSVGAEAQDAETFYKDKMIKVIVGSSPGGGYDTYARLVQRHLGSQLSGNPNIIVQNMPGAGSVKATNHLYNAAKRDGTEIGAIQPQAVFEPLYNHPGTRFDAKKFTWIGGLNTEPSTCLVWHTSGVKTIQEAMETAFTVGGTAAGSGPYIIPRVLNATIGTKMKLIPGYPGTKEITRAMEGGEVEGVCGWSWSSVMIQRAAWVKEKKIIPLVQLGLRKHKALPEVPLALDFAKTATDRQILEITFAPYEMERPYLAPPGLPPSRAQALRAAFDAMTKDDAFLRDAERLRLDINPTTGTAIETLLERVYATPKDILARVTKMRQ